MDVPGGPGVVGAIKAGTNISISADGTISASAGGQPIGTVTSVGVSGGTTGLTFSGSPVTSSGTMTMDGVLAIAHGGTGATTQAAAAAAVLPSQSGQSGKFLQTNGSVTSWASVPVPDVFPAGTNLVFVQDAAPTGWVQRDDIDNRAIKIVGGAGGGQGGGSIPFSTLFDPSSTYSGAINITSGQVGASGLSVEQLAGHTHGGATNAEYGYNFGSSGRAGGGANCVQTYLLQQGLTVYGTGSYAAHTHSLVGAAATGNFVSNFDLAYVTAIVCQKS